LWDWFEQVVEELQQLALIWNDEEILRSIFLIDERMSSNLLMLPADEVPINGRFLLRMGTTIITSSNKKKERNYPIIISSCFEDKNSDESKIKFQKIVVWKEEACKPDFWRKPDFQTWIQLDSKYQIHSKSLHDSQATQAT